MTLIPDLRNQLLESYEQPMRNRPGHVLGGGLRVAAVIAVIVAMVFGAGALTGPGPADRTQPAAPEPAATSTATVPAGHSIEEEPLTVPGRLADLVVRADPEVTHRNLIAAGYEPSYDTLRNFPGPDPEFSPAKGARSPEPDTLILSVLSAKGALLDSDDETRLLIELVPREPRPAPTVPNLRGRRALDALRTIAQAEIPYLLYVDGTRTVIRPGAEISSLEEYRDCRITRQNPKRGRLRSGRLELRMTCPQP